MKTKLMRCSIVSWLAVAVLSPAISAAVGDVTLRTCHPQYAGEGAFQTVEDCVAFATAGQEGDQQRALAVYNWILTHQFHLYSPQEWCVPGLVPGENRDNYDMIVYDANRARFSYGYGLCGTVHAWNEPYWRALGMNARRRAFPGHVNSEIEYGGAWHAFDTDMAGLVFRQDGVVAGYDDIRRDPSLVQLNDRGIVCYPFAWPGDFEVMKKGWQQIAEGGHWYNMYNSGYAALPAVVQVRRGETFTRYFDRDVFGGPARRRFWHNQKDGPFRNWTFVNRGEPEQHGGQANCRGNASYANAVFEYSPDLQGSHWREGTVEHSANLLSQQASPHLTSRTAAPASVTFEHFSPYVICGDPADDANPMTGAATDGLVVTGQAAGEVTLELSLDQGQSWQTLDPLRSEFQQDLTNQVKGHYGWWLRFSFARGAGLDRLAFVTTCQMNQAIYPRLTANGCDVVYRVASRAVVAVKPNWGLAEEEATRMEARNQRSANIRYTPRGKQQITAYTTVDNKPGMVVFRVDSPTPLVEVTAAARYRVRSPEPEGCDFHLDLSIDNGRSWQTFARAYAAADNEYSSGWMYGRVPITAAKITSALVRVHLYAGGYPTGLIDFEAYGLRTTSLPDTAEISWAWNTPGTAELSTHKTWIEAGVTKRTVHVPTPAQLTDAFVTIRVP